MSASRNTASHSPRKLGRVFGLFTFAVILLLFAPVPTHANSSASFAWTASITPDSTIANAQFDVSFTGLGPSSAIQITLQPTNLVVGDKFSNADGAAQFAFGVPPTIAPGEYSIRAAGVSNSGNAFLVVVATFTVAPSGSVNGASVNDGVLALDIPVGAVGTFQQPVLESGRSVTRGSLSTFIVRDERAASKPGWMLMASVSALTLSSDSSVTMSEAQLGIQPLVISGGSGVNAGLGTTPGVATAQFVFAEAPAGTQAATTTLGGNLTLLAPPQLPVGTYTGTITLTLMSR